MARDKKIALMHRLFGVETGHVCGECINCISRRYRTKVLRKCAVYGLTHSEASDWAKSWTACKMFWHEYSGRPVIELRKSYPEPGKPLDGQMDLFGGNHNGFDRKTDHRKGEIPNPGR